MDHQCYEQGLEAGKTDVAVPGVWVDLGVVDALRILLDFTRT